LRFDASLLCAFEVPAADPLPDPVPPVVPAVEALVPAAEVPARDELPLPAALAAEPPGALPIGGSGGGEEPAPRPPLKVGLPQFDALSCCAG
jgi:hypothetical protein